MTGAAWSSAAVIYIVVYKATTINSTHCYHMGDTILGCIWLNYGHTPLLYHPNSPYKFWTPLLSTVCKLVDHSQLANCLKVYESSAFQICHTKHYHSWPRVKLCHVLLQLLLTMASRVFRSKGMGMPNQVAFPPLTACTRTKRDAQEQCPQVSRGLHSSNRMRLITALQYAGSKRNFKRLLLNPIAAQEQVHPLHVHMACGLCDCKSCKPSAAVCCSPNVQRHSMLPNR